MPAENIYLRQVLDRNLNPVPAFESKRDLALSVSGVSVLPTTLQTDADDGVCRVVSTAGIYMKKITSGCEFTPVDSTNYYLPADKPELLRYKSGDIIIAVNKSDTAVLHITELK